ncbi:hypothetical protein [Rhodococcus sp. BP22]|nr:hypothetical protein [Rhodococcus sp. BP22]
MQPGSVHSARPDEWITSVPWQWSTAAVQSLQDMVGAPFVGVLY